MRLSFSSRQDSRYEAEVDAFVRRGHLVRRGMGFLARLRADSSEKKQERAEKNILKAQCRSFFHKRGLHGRRAESKADAFVRRKEAFGVFCKAECPARVNGKIVRRTFQACTYEKNSESQFPAILSIWCAFRDSNPGHPD